MVSTQSPSHFGLTRKRHLNARFRMLVSTKFTAKLALCWRAEAPFVARKA